MNKTTFKQELALEADELAKMRDISEEIRYIKLRLKESVTNRVFYIHLIVAYDTMAIGGHSSNIYDIFVPKGIAPESYRQLFVDELKKLGFTDEDIELSFSRNKIFDSYDIKLKW